MKVLLVLPHHRIHNYGYISYEDSDYPLGLGYVAAVVQEHFKPEILDVLDFQLRSTSIERLKQQLKEKQYDIIGLSVSTPTFGPALELARIIKEVHPQGKIVAGGPFMSMNPGEMIAACPELDLEFIGETEATIPEAFAALTNKRPLNNVKGIAYRGDNDQVVITERRPLITELDTIPFPKRDIFRLNEYTSLPGQFFKKPIMPMTATRGCPFRCRFCEDHIIWQGKFRRRSAENIYQEMEELVKRFGAQEIKFFDDTFTASRPMTVALCELLIKRKLGVIWRMCSRVDTVDEELCKLMYAAGLRSINFGIESGSDRILKAMNKGFTKEKVRRAVKASKEAGIETKASFILNYPGDTVETTLETVKFADELDLDFVGYNLFNPLMGRQLKEYVEKNYRINEKAWNDRNVSAVNTIFFYQDALPPEFLQNVYKKAMRSHYLKPRNIFKALLRIKNFEMVKSYFDGFRRLFKLELYSSSGGEK
jgi:radical SAM superfamily enzyme YgiQ (UPF0313 family)